jgi:hypothetical protein
MALALPTREQKASLGSAPCQSSTAARLLQRAGDERNGGDDREGEAKGEAVAHAREHSRGRSEGLWVRPLRGR